MTVSTVLKHYLHIKYQHVPIRQHLSTFGPSRKLDIHDFSLVLFTAQWEVLAV